MSELSDQTKRLEPALRYLSTHLDAKVKVVAVKFKVSPAALWAWLGAFNHSRPNPPSHVIDNCLRDSAPAAGVMPAESKPWIPHRISVGGGLAKTSVRAVPVRKLLSIPEAVGGPRDNFATWLASQGLVAKEVISYVIDVTPELASTWLSFNTGNRKPSRAKIARFADLIRAGKWLVNGETVKFFTSGRLIDGQSRLRAIIEANKPALIEVRGGIADEAQRAMDCGEVRRSTHTLEMLGYEHPNVLSPALRLIFKLENGGLGSGGGHGRMGVMENLAVPALLARHSGLAQSVAWAVGQGHRMRKFMPLSEAAFLHYVFSGAGLLARDSFFEGLRTGSAMSQPVALLRKRITDAVNGRMAPGLRLKLVVKAWNAHAQKRQLQELVLAPRESVAAIYGAPERKAAA